MTQPPVPDVILSLIYCGCKTGSSPEKRMCSCVRQGLPCTDSCKYVDCGNRLTTVTYSDDQQDDTDTEE